MGSFATKSLDYGTPFTQKIDYNGGTNATYVGEAAPGSSASAGKLYWRIKKLTYDVNNNVTDVQWASGNQDFNKDWSLRASYTYS